MRTHTASIHCDCAPASSGRAGFRVVIPEIVVREVTTKPREREAQTLQKLENVSERTRKQLAGAARDELPAPLVRAVELALASARPGPLTYS